MSWKDESDRDSIYRSATSDYEKQILQLAEAFAEGEEGEEIPPEYTNDQIINAMLLVVSHFEGGDEFFDCLTIIEKALVMNLMRLVIAVSAEQAASESHQGEADETILDSEE